MGGLKKKKLKQLGAKIGITVNSGGLGPVPTGGSVGPIINNRRRRSLDEDGEVEETEEYEDLEEIETLPIPAGYSMPYESEEETSKKLRHPKEVYKRSKERLRHPQEGNLYSI